MTSFEIEVNTPSIGVEVAPKQTPVTPGGEKLIIAATPGPRGPQGPPGGGSSEGTAWWYGEGPPATLIGSKPGDYYIDTLTGLLYKLGD